MSSGRQESLEATDISTGTTTKKGITSRFSNLFNTRPSHIKEFSIRLEEDGISQGIKQYGPGEVVKGKVILDVARPLGVTHVVVRLSGFVDVFKNHKHRVPQSSENGRMTKRRGRRWTSEYFGDGFASLFEDEIVVCGDGRLDPRPWHFEFSIGFPSQLNLPSSIKFERGQISYSVTATLTRPAAINPSISTGRTLRYRETIDVARYPPPKAREATLKPINPQNSPRAGLRRLTSGDKSPLRTATASPLRHVEYKRSSVASSDAPTPTIAGSRNSSSSRATESVTSIPVSSSDSASRQAVQSPHVSVGLTKGACLPGQIVHVLVKVDHHHKAVWRRNGIIVTLHREGRTDFQPNLPLSADAEGQDKYEDYYPRSRSGIGGMSMDNAGSDKKFQQDLSQTIAPLLINPGTMSAEVKVAVRVPVDAIPTIKGVPGNMISFRYYVETIIDIQGRLSMHDRAIAGATADPNAGEEAQMTIWAPNCIDTTSMKQNKNAIRLKSELIIGTSDSMGSAKPQPRHVPEVPLSLGSQERVVSPPNHVQSSHANGTNYSPAGFYGSPTQPMSGSSHFRDEAYDNGWGHDEYEAHDYDQWGETGDYSGYGYEYHDNDTASNGYPRPYYDPPPHFQSSANRPEQLQPFIPLPSTADEEGLSEKQKLARHEAALLPSQPEGPSSSTQTPSAPPPLEGDHFTIAPVLSSPLVPRDYGNKLSNQTDDPVTAPSRNRSHDLLNGQARPRSEATSETIVK